MPDIRSPRLKQHRFTMWFLIVIFLLMGLMLRGVWLFLSIVFALGTYAHLKWDSRSR